ncbi:MAG TPA: hypothetical protein VJ695_09590 [Nitrososphaera sp.]|nr:hypothetical protein [Nitrososphaera sp.]
MIDSQYVLVSVCGSVNPEGRNKPLEVGGESSAIYERQIKSYDAVAIVL